jgi:hypothetical protein
MATSPDMFVVGAIIGEGAALDKGKPRERVLLISGYLRSCGLRGSSSSS